MNTNWVKMFQNKTENRKGTNYLEENQIPPTQTQKHSSEKLGPGGLLCNN